ncbi:MAG: hypothetical protein B6244_05155 [Candidatus Cloacimonetes bacterium 4572_55]|nr:MAG: hypothetical protein B6244_05155 [Candidatus Cloacimonetes bacterium 4572_55]
MKKMLWLLPLLLLHCGVYSFRSGSLPPEIKTVYIPIFESELQGEETNIDIKERITETLQEEFTRTTRLTLADEENSDSIFIGSLRRYTREVANYDESENPIDYKITLIIKCEFTNLVADQVIWQQSGFASFEFYEVDESQDDLGEEEALEQLIDKAARDMVIKATENW